MRRAVWLVVLAVLVFVGVIVARLPASWLAPDPRSGVACADLDGTIWDGACTGLKIGGAVLGDLSWEARASRLLAGKLNAALVLTRADGVSHGTIEVGLDRVLTARDIQADLPLDPRLIPQLPPGLSGKLHAQIASLRIEHKLIKALTGQIQVLDLTSGVGPNAQPWGSYEVSFPPAASGGEPTGQLHDLGGPLQVKGSLRLTREPGYDVQLLVKAQPNAPAELARDIQFLGSPDAQGWRQTGLAGAF